MNDCRILPGSRKAHRLKAVLRTLYTFRDRKTSDVKDAFMTPLESLIATGTSFTIDQAVQTALQQNPAVLSARQEIRRTLVASPLMDEAGIVRDVENAYREMWRTWCRAPS